MPSKAKVGSWLEKSNGVDASEAYESSEGSASGSEDERDGGTRSAAKEIETRGDFGQADGDEEEEEYDRHEDVDWDKVIPRLRSAMVDPSQKRRRVFLSRYLNISKDSECKSIMIVPL
jgi:hypothetical protein